MPDHVVIVDYNPRWPLLYEEERRLIEAAMGQWLVAIEHIGGTSVPGLAAKPIIDIMAAVRDLADVVHCLEPLAAVGYVYRPPESVGIPDRRYFNKGPQDNHRHLHIYEVDSRGWREHLLFRDDLRAHAEAAQEYAALKRSLAARYGADREGYTEAKTSSSVRWLYERRAGRAKRPADDVKAPGGAGISGRTAVAAGAACCRRLARKTCMR